jgi:hypothetical protein
VWDDNANTPLAQILTSAATTIAFVATEPVRTVAWPSSLPRLNCACFHQGDKHGLFVDQTRSYQQYQGLAAPISANVQLGTEPSTAASQGFVSSPFPSPSGVLMSANDRSIHKMQRPIHMTLRICLLQKRGEKVLPKALTLPAIIAICQRTPGTISFRKVAPGGSGREYPEDAIDDQPVSMIRAATSR